MSPQVTDVTINLGYLLRKQDPQEPFDSELRIQIPIQRGINPANQQQMEQARQSDAVFGLQIQQGAGSSKLFFHRLQQVNNIEFPDDNHQDLSLKSVFFHIQGNLIDLPNPQTNISASAKIPKSRYKVSNNFLPAGIWLALVTFVNGEFELLLDRSSGPGPGDPCAALDCSKVANYIPCFLAGCYN